MVKGSVSSDAATVRVRAQLFDAQTGRVIWSEIYNRAPTPGALLSVQAELAAGIATELGQPYGVINSDMTARLSGGVEPSMESYACVLRAHMYRRTFRDELRQPVLACLEDAVERDPDYAVPWALLGWLHLDAARYRLRAGCRGPARDGAGARLCLQGGRDRPRECGRAAGAFGGPVPPRRLRRVRAHPTAGAGAEPERPRYAGATRLAAGVPWPVGGGPRLYTSARSRGP